MSLHLRTGDARRLELKGRTALELLGSATPDAGVTVRIVEVAPELPGAPARPLHVHDGVGEFIWILAGAGTAMSETGPAFEAVAGEGIFVPAGERHKIVPRGEEPLRLLCVFATDDLAARTRE